MCGIAGFFGPNGDGRFGTALREVMPLLRHRGPDGEGIWLPPAPETGAAVGLANVRLAIVDLSAAGHQPMSTEDDRWTITYNGEIYNHRELRQELERLGHRFRSRSDTEVLLAGFAQWGTAVLPRLSGMFAFAIYDRVAGRIVLARDPFGIKPLYYAFRDGNLVFASEIPAVLAVSGVSRDVDVLRYQDFLLSGNTDFGPGTLFANVRQLPSAHFLEASVAAPQSAVPTRYWQPDLTQELDCSFERAAELVREAFMDSMRLHLRSDAPLAFSLSGGNDSSAIVMTARAILGAGSELHTFSFIPDDPRINEEQYIDTVVRASGATGHKLRLEPEDLRRDIEQLTSLQAEPFASPVIYAQYRVFRMARERGFKVILGGEGADEILAGYERYYIAGLASLLRQHRWRSLPQLFRRPAVPLQTGRARSLRAALWLALPGRLINPARAWRSRQQRSLDWLDAEWFEARGVQRSAAWSPTGPYVMRELLDHNLRESQVQAMVRFEDRNAMSLSMENRVPYLSTRLAQLLFALPERYLVAPDGTRKAVFRKAMRGLVPDSILDRREKVGFSVPAIDWFNTLKPWIDGRLNHVLRLGGVKRAGLTRRWQELGTGPGKSDLLLVWRCVSLSVWSDRFGVKFD